MASYEIVYSNIVVQEDIPRLGTTDKRRIENLIGTKLTTAPDQFGKPLRRPHNGYWVLRAGNYRIVYAISRNIVRVVVILPRDRVYEELTQRLKRGLI
ncbi:MAG: type II toxin-antitoxin system RelE/ParE family toxin [Candidatus Vogelbacteria bacterium]